MSIPDEDARPGRSLVPLRKPDKAWLRPALAALVEYVKRGGETEAMPLLLEAGFRADPRRAVLRP